MIRGIDVWKGQGDVPWADLAKSGIAFAIVKASTGNDPGVDKRFAENVAGAKGAGLLVGCYNFVYPLPPDPGKPLRDPAAQAKHHFDQCGGLGSHDGDLPPFVDAEWPAPQDWARWGCSAPQIRAWLKAYLQAAESLWGRKPTLYTYPDWAAHVALGDEPDFGQWRLWAASYTHPDRWPVEGETPAAIAPWGANWAFWQVSGGTMSLWGGVDVDCDVFKGSLDDLKALASPGATAAVAQSAILQASDEIPEV